MSFWDKLTKRPSELAGEVQPTPAPTPAAHAPAAHVEKSGTSYKLTSWLIHRYPATKTRAAHADVTLRGVHQGAFRNRRYWERLSIPLPPDDTGDEKSDKRLVKLAEEASTHKWHGHM